jgi:hypothetical protein
MKENPKRPRRIRYLPPLPEGTKRPAKIPRNIPRDLIPAVAQETENSEGPTHEQLSTARVQFVFALEDIIRKKAEKEHEWEEHHNPKSYTEVKRTIKNLVILYVLKDNGLPLDKFRKKHKEKADEYERMLKDINPAIDLAKTEIMERAAEIKEDEREKTTKEALGKLRNGNHRRALLGLEEPDPAQRKKERGKTAVSTGWSIATTVGALAAPGAGVVYAANQNFVDLGSITDWKTFLAIAGVSAVNAGVIYANYRAQLYSLDKVGISMSIIAKGSHYTTTKLLPKNERLTRRAVFLATAVPSNWQLPLLTLGLLIPGAGPLATIAFVGHGLASIGLNATEAAGTAAYTGARELKGAVQARRNEQHIPPLTAK